MDLEQVKQYLTATVTADNKENLSDIAWKYAIGDIILTLADQQGLKVEPKSRLDIFENDCLIGDKICILVRPVQSEDNVTSEGDSSESQLNPKEDLG